MAHSEGALTLPSNVGSIVGEMELINQGNTQMLKTCYSSVYSYANKRCLEC
jgi:hypothetical protein